MQGSADTEIATGRSKTERAGVHPIAANWAVATNEGEHTGGGREQRLVGACLAGRQERRGAQGRHDPLPVADGHLHKERRQGDRLAHGAGRAVEEGVQPREEDLPGREEHPPQGEHWIQYDPEEEWGRDNEDGREDMEDEDKGELLDQQP